jgi:hypothetical protein
MCDLEMKVAPLITDFAIPRGQRLPALLSVSRTWLSAPQPPLSVSQSLRRCTLKPWIADIPPVGNSGESCDAQIDSDLATCGRQRPQGHIVARQN